MKKNTTYAGGKRRLKVVGHRGARALAPENTVASVLKALEHGVDEIEIDVRVTKDSIPVLHHDRELQDPTTARYDIHYHTYDELKLHKPDLTTLEEAITVIGKQVPLQIEVKFGEPTVPVIRTLQIFLSKGWKETDFLVGSKSQRTLLDIHKNLPAMPLVVIEPFSGLRASWRARRLGAKRVSMNHWWLWSFFIRTFAGSGYELYAYTVNKPSRVRPWVKYGLQGVITDRPDLFR